MARITFVVDAVNNKNISGGMICIMRYAQGLAEKGHDVSLFSILPSKNRVFLSSNVNFINSNSKQLWASLWKSVGATFYNLPKARAGYKSRRQLLLSLNALFDRISVLSCRYFSYAQRRATSLVYSEAAMPDSDITIATGFQTALPVFLYGRGDKFYFAQHFEPYFKNEFLDPKLAEAEALLSYHLGLRAIANSSWLAGILQKHGVPTVELCVNAIDQEMFSPDSLYQQALKNKDEFTLISYGGRNAEWKGFLDIAKAVRLVRERNKGKDIRWRVFGEALLPPRNEIANYESLGYVTHQRLAQCYREADILVSASWYESFPLFPLEAMACGTAVITTPLGTEDYAVHEETAEVVPSRNPEALAAALEKLLRDDNYRLALARAGAKKAYEFTWDRAVERMESILLRKRTPML